MKKSFAFLVLISLLLLSSCTTVQPYQGDPIASPAATDTHPWPTDTFFAAAPNVTSSVKNVSINDDKTTYSIQISNISYNDFVSWTKAMKESGVSPIGSGEYGLDGTPIDGLASFNGETRQYTVLSTWTDSPDSDCALSISFIKK